MNRLELVKNTQGSNDKIISLKGLLQTEDKNLFEYILRTTYDSSIKFGLSDKTLMKVFHIDSLKGYDDLGEWVDKNFPYVHNIDLNLNDLRNIVNETIKLTGQKQINYLGFVLKKLCKSDVVWICRMLLKDLRIGIGLKSINKIFNELEIKEIFNFKCQLCSVIKEISFNDNEMKKVVFPCYVETKYDGTRTKAYLEEGKIRLMSRQGKETTKQFPEIVKALNEFVKINDLHNCWFDGEIISSDFNSLQKRLGRKEENINEDSSLSYTMFDMSFDNSFKDRRDILEKYTYTNKIKLSEGIECNSIEEIQKYFNIMMDRKEEGLIVKNLNSYYEGDRKGWFKIKPVYDADVTIINAKYGTGRKSNNIASLQISDEEGRSCWVGSGITDYWLKELTKLWDEKILLGHTVEIQYGELTKESYRFPRFITLRYDK